jgi:hypothetical protein
MYNSAMSESNETEKQKKKLLNYHPSAYLLGAQLVQMLLFSIFHKNVNQHTLISALSVLILVLVIWVIDRSSTIPWLKWWLFTPAFLLSLTSAIIGPSVLAAWAALMDAILYFFAVISLIVYMMGDDQVTTDELFAICATYTLLAFGFAYLYMVCQLWVPNSFVSPIVGDRPLVFNEMLFLSFTNLSSTGLSDISPASSWARTIMTMEQMSGGLYIAIVVSRLVGMTTRKRSKKQDQAM